MVKEQKKQLHCKDWRNLTDLMIWCVWCKK